MKKNICLFLLLFATIISFAQSNNSDQCKSLLTLKQEFIAKHYTLPESKKEKFWEIYNEYLRSEAVISTTFRNELLRLDIKRAGGIIESDSLNDVQIKGLILAKFKLKEDKLRIDKKLFLDLSPILSMQEYYELTEVIKLFKSNIKEVSKDACKHEN